MVWLADESQTDAILKVIAELSLQCGMLVHPIILLDKEKHRLHDTPMYETMILSAEKIFEH